VLNFTAIDFETANSSSASACSVGMVKVHDGIVVDSAYWLIRTWSPSSTATTLSPTMPGSTSA
jgi:DNA polymerase III epsilon subunit-like protein